MKISFVTPLPGAFTKPIATKMLSELLEEKNIEVIPEYLLDIPNNYGIDIDIMIEAKKKELLARL